MIEKETRVFKKKFESIYNTIRRTKKCKFLYSIKHKIQNITKLTKRGNFYTLKILTSFSVLDLAT